MVPKEREKRAVGKQTRRKKSKGSEYEQNKDEEKRKRQRKRLFCRNKRHWERFLWQAHLLAELCAGVRHCVLQLSGKSHD